MAPPAGERDRLRRFATGGERLLPCQQVCSGRRTRDAPCTSPYTPDSRPTSSASLTMPMHHFHSAIAPRTPPDNPACPTALIQTGTPLAFGRNRGCRQPRFRRCAPNLSSARTGVDADLRDVGLCTATRPHAATGCGTLQWYRCWFQFRGGSVVGRGRPVASGSDGARPGIPPGPRLPRGALSRVNLGQSFAEYDAALDDETVYVHTPALAAAQDPTSGKVFFVGRRGTGKTAIRRYCGEGVGHTRIIVPAIFSPSSTISNDIGQEYAHRRPFQSLVSAFRRSLQVELLLVYVEAHPARTELCRLLADEIDELGQLDFDARSLEIIHRVMDPLASGREEEWLRENKMARTVAEEMKLIGSAGQPMSTVLVDSIDDYWEGTEEGLVYLTAFMHACQEISAQIPWARAILFLRENIFERIRSRDTESARLETAVVAMEWNERQLLELVERRLNRTLTAKLPLNGDTWKMYVENPDTAWSEILDYCQRRPRDVLIYVSNAVEAAQAAGHSQITLEDVQSARRRFSDNRLRDLGDEYAENYPRLDEVLKRFYGLGRSFALRGIESLARKMLQDGSLTRMCGDWIFGISAPEAFVRLLYNIGFVGLRSRSGSARFRALGPQDTSPPPVNDATDIMIHRCYWDALDLQDVLVTSLNEDVEFGRIGLIQELPGGVSAAEYSDHLDVIQESLRELAVGAGGAADFEDIVGDVVKLCFFRSLNNVEAKSRTYDGRAIRDWVASNRADAGFWGMIRARYGATQVVWECKNYAELSAEDFHQAAYYMSDAGGRFAVLAFRGEIKPGYYDHVSRIHRDRGGLVLLLTERDIMTFLRQARNGKVKEDHIQDRYDMLVRRIS